VLVVDHEVCRQVSNSSFFLLKHHHWLVAGDSILIPLTSVEMLPLLPAGPKHLLCFETGGQYLIAYSILFSAIYIELFKTKFKGEGTKSSKSPHL